MKKLLQFATFFLLFASLASAASLQRPEVMLDSVTQEMLTTLKKNDSEIKRNPAKLVSIIEKVLVPHVDSTDMARWVVGRNGWVKATPSQRSRFTSEFKDLLIRTYASSLTAYKNQTIEYLPVKTDISKKRRVQVLSLIREPGRTPINVSYRLVKRGDEWKVYDIIIEGVSLLKGFKSQFANDIKQFGLDPVIEKIQEHNQKPLS